MDDKKNMSKKPKSWVKKNLPTARRHRVAAGWVTVALAIVAGVFDHWNASDGRAVLWERIHAGEQQRSAEHARDAADIAVLKQRMDDAEKTVALNRRVEDALDKDMQDMIKAKP